MPLFSLKSDVRLQVVKLRKIESPITQEKLLSTQPKNEFEYTFMPYLLYKMTTDEVVLMEWIITFILNQLQYSNRSLELKYDCNIQQNSRKLHVGVRLLHICMKLAQN